MNTPPILSIVVPTFNRVERLRACVGAIRRNCDCSCEIIVIDGGSTDGARQWLGAQSDVRSILEPEREGAVRAFNKGFRAAIGTYVMWLNDDAELMPGSVAAGIGMIERPDLQDVGLVAFYHNWHHERNVLDRIERDGETFEMCHVRGYPYANFGLLRRTLLERVGYADERFYFFGFDPDLSLKIQLGEGLKVLGCRGATVRHEEHHDNRKLSDLTAGDDDNRKLFAKWRLPEPGDYPDPVPGYRDLLRRRGLL